MFTTPHFIWLAISIIIIVASTLLQVKFKLSYNFILNFMIVMSAISEAVKISCNLMPSPYREGGMYLDPGDLPFHLCSIQIFLMVALKFFAKSESSKKLLLGFMAPTQMLGAIIALFVPTVGVNFDNIQVWQYFIFHAFLIAFSLYIVRAKLVDWKWKRYFYNLGLIACFAFFAMWVNSFLSVSAEVDGAFRRANFMYLTYPPMEGLPLLNLNNGWGAYFLTLVILVVVLVGIFHFIVTPKPWLKKKDK